jgi:DNA-directed RNA polymerase subunit RPC12/RpoP
MEKYYKISDVNAAVERLLREPYYQHNGESWYSCVSAMADALTLLTPTFVDEPKVGKWISASTKPGVHAGMKCSLCKARISYSEYFNGQHLYCHKCGAKMLVEVPNENS